DVYERRPRRDRQKLNHAGPQRRHAQRIARMPASGSGGARRCAAMGTQQVVQVRGGSRAGEVVALGTVAAELPQQLEGAGVFDPFRDDLEVEAVAELDRGANDRSIAVVDREVADEGAVDLDLADRETTQVGERGVTGAEVVDGEADAHRRQLLQQLLRTFRIAHQHRLRDLQLEPLRGCTFLLENRGDVVDKAVV